MREIKFRAWHTALNEWLTDELMRQYITWMKGELYVPANIRLMQFTGLKDKNGAEIYEGDIVKVSVSYKNDEVFPISWGRDMWLFGSFGNLSEALAFSDSGGCEVIGNIYEHSHLLEESK